MITDYDEQIILDMMANDIRKKEVAKNEKIRRVKAGE